MNETLNTTVICTQCKLARVITVYYEVAAGDMVESKCYCGSKWCMVVFSVKKPRISTLDMMCDSILQ